MALPADLLNSLQNIPGFERGPFEAIHASGEQVTSIRVNKLKFDPSLPGFHHSLQNVPWCAEGFYLPERPYFTHDPFLHAGVYYVQEASSMFLSYVMKEVMRHTTTNIRVLDLCAAPGGKSTLLLNEIGEEGLLVSNEVIKSRASILEENITKWGMPNVVVTNNDPKHFASLEGFFDVMLIDAPCSGSGLFRRDKDAISEWSTENVDLCSQRQRRIIADAWNCLKKDGFLIYSTCSYSREEDEEILDWMADAFSVESLSFDVASSWNITKTHSPKHSMAGYRFYPDKVKGEGFFIACIQKKEGPESYHQHHRNSFTKVSGSENEVVSKWVNNDRQLLSCYHHKENLFAFPSKFEEELIAISNHLFIKKAGVSIGSFAGKELIPDHALAVSTILRDDVVRIELNKEQAIAYLKKETINPQTDHKGWSLVTYAGRPLGWVKVLPNRANNYYPKEWRVLK